MIRASSCSISSFSFLQASRSASSDSASSALSKTTSSGVEVYQVRQRGELAVLSLNPGVEQAALGNATRVLLTTDEVPDTKVARRPQHETGQRVTEKSRGRESDRRVPPCIGSRKRIARAPHAVAASMKSWLRTPNPRTGPLRFTVSCDFETE